MFISCEHTVTQSRHVICNATTFVNAKLKGKKVKLSHTRYRVLGPELIPVYRQSSPALGTRLPLLSARSVVTFPAKERHRHSTSTKLYCSGTQV